MLEFINLPWPALSPLRCLSCQRSVNRQSNSPSHLGCLLIVGFSLGGTVSRVPCTFIRPFSNKYTQKPRAMQMSSIFLHGRGDTGYAAKPNINIFTRKRTIRESLHRRKANTQHYLTRFIPHTGSTPICKIPSPLKHNSPSHSAVGTIKF